MRVKCVKIEDIEICEQLAIDDDESGDRWLLRSVLIGGERLSWDECEQLARCDGFGNFAEMMKFWDGRLPFRGDIVIHWWLTPETTHVPFSPLIPTISPTFGVRMFGMTIVSHSAKWIAIAVKMERHQYLEFSK
jgi:hypothetical protein